MTLLDTDPRCQTGTQIQTAAKDYQVVGLEDTPKVNYGRTGGKIDPGLFVTTPYASDVTWISAETVARSWVVYKAPSCPDVFDESEAA